MKEKAKKERKDFYVHVWRSLSLGVSSLSPVEFVSMDGYLEDRYVGIWI